MGKGKKGNANKQPKQQVIRFSVKQFSIKEGDKKIYGGYFNMGLCNYYKAISHIFSVLGIRQIVTTKFNDEYVKVPMYSEENLYVVLRYFKKFIDDRTQEESIKKKIQSALRLKSQDQELQKINDEELDDLMKSLHLTNEQLVKFQQLLFKHFPVLGPIMADVVSKNVNDEVKKAIEGEDDEKVINRKKSKVIQSYDNLRGVTLSQCLEEVANLGECLKDCRHYYTHYRPYNSQNTQKKIFDRQYEVAKKLNKVLTASRRIDKRRNALTSEQMEFLTGTDHFKKVDKKFIERESFYFNLKGQRIASTTSKDQEGIVTTISTTHRALSDFGVAYFCATFLSKTYERKFLDEIKLLKTSPLLFDIPASDENLKKVSMQELSDADIANHFRQYCKLQNINDNNIANYVKTFIGDLFNKNEDGTINYSDTPKGVIRVYIGNPLSEQENKLMEEILAVYRVRTPRGKRLDSQSNSITLGMDMLNELRKCPMELYDTLPIEGQKFFEDKVKRENEHTPEIVKRLRSKDRFAELALHYIDEQKKFNDVNIRFQIRLGSFRYKFYDKICVDGEERVRRIQKEVNGYGRIQDVETERKKKWEDDLQKANTQSVKLEHEDLYLDLLQFEKDHKDSTPYITDRRAEYNIHRNRIGMLWNQDSEEKKYLQDEGLYYLPELTVTGENDNRKSPLDMPAPLCSISIYELPAMLFYQYLQENYNDSNGKEYYTTEQIIKTKYDGLVKFFTDIKNGMFVHQPDEKSLKIHLEKTYKLFLTDIPVKLRQYITDEMPEETPMEHLLDLTIGEKKDLGRLIPRIKRLEHRRDTYKQDREKIGDKTNNYGKKSFVDVRHGSLAKFLVRDIVGWQGSKNNGRDKLTGLNYTAIQAFLSVYGQKDEYGCKELEEMLRRSNLLKQRYQSLPKDKDKRRGLKKFDSQLENNPIAHPFLDAVLQCSPRNIEEFYLFYLDEEIKKLKSLAENLIKAKNQEASLNNIPFIHTNRVKYQDRTSEEAIRQLAARYLEISDKDANGSPVKHRATILLPDGMFVNYIHTILADNFKDNKEFIKAISHQDNPATYKQNGKHDNSNKNAAHHITQFFEKILGDHSQEYYYAKDSRQIIEEDDAYGDRAIQRKGDYDRFARNYDIFKLLHDHIKGAEVMPYYLSPQQINDQISKRAKDKLGKDIPLENKVTTDGAPRFLKEIQLRIDRLVNKKRQNAINKALHPKFGKPKKPNYQKLDIADEELHERLEHAILFCKENEKAIRRYKTQDMVLFLLAKQLIENAIQSEDSSDCSEKFKLGNICKDNFLKQTVRYEFPVTTSDGHTVKVTQPNMSLKNYGEFYRLLSDERFISMLEQLKDIDVINYNKLMAELVTYDNYRSEIFGVIHKVEENIYKQKEIIHDENHDLDEFYIDNDKNKMAKRNNFSEMLELLKDVDTSKLTKEERSMFVKIRNAFSHNHMRIPFRNWMTEDEHEEYKEWMAKDDVPKEKQQGRIAPPNISDHIFKKANELKKKSGCES